MKNLILIIAIFCSSYSYAELNDEALQKRSLIYDSFMNRVTGGELVSDDLKLLVRIQRYRATWQELDLQDFIKNVIGDKYELQIQGSKLYYISEKYTVIEDPVGHYFRVSNNTCGRLCYLNEDLEEVTEDFEGQTHFSYKIFNDGESLIENLIDINSQNSRAVALMIENDPRVKVVLIRELEASQQWSQLNPEEQSLIIRFAKINKNSFVINALIDLAKSSKDLQWIEVLNSWMSEWKQDITNGINWSEKWKESSLRSAEAAVLVINSANQQTSTIQPNIGEAAPDTEEDNSVGEVLVTSESEPPRVARTEEEIYEAEANDYYVSYLAYLGDPNLANQLKFIENLPALHSRIRLKILEKILDSATENTEFLEAVYTHLALTNPMNDQARLELSKRILLFAPSLAVRTIVNIGSGELMLVGIQHITKNDNLELILNDKSRNSSIVSLLQALKAYTDKYSSTSTYSKRSRGYALLVLNKAIEKEVIISEKVFYQILIGSAKSDNELFETSNLFLEFFRILLRNSDSNEEIVSEIINIAIQSKSLEQKIDEDSWHSYVLILRLIREMALIDQDMFEFYSDIIFVFKWDGIDVSDMRDLNIRFMRANKISDFEGFMNSSTNIEFENAVDLFLQKRAPGVISELYTHSPKLTCESVLN